MSIETKDPRAAVDDAMDAFATALLEVVQVEPGERRPLPELAAELRTRLVAEVGQKHGSAVADLVAERLDEKLRRPDMSRLTDRTRPQNAAAFVTGARVAVDALVDELWPLVDDLPEVAAAEEALRQVQARQRATADQLAAAVATADVEAFQRVRPEYELTLPNEVDAAAGALLEAREKHAGLVLEAAQRRATSRTAAVQAADAAVDRAKAKLAEAERRRDVAAAAETAWAKAVAEREAAVSRLASERQIAERARQRRIQQRFERLTGALASAAVQPLLVSPNGGDGTR